jgi:ferrous iron transport protein B
MWSKASQYIKKMGGVIMIASIIIWALGHYPVRVSYTQDFAGHKAEIEKRYEDQALLLQDNTRLLRLQQKKDSELQSLDIKMKAEHQEKSYIGQIGKQIEPLIRPLGFDWKMGVCLLTGVAAKEIVVSTMGVIYQANEGEEYKTSLQEKIKNATYSSGVYKGKPVFNPLATISFILFTLFYFPCIATVAAIYKESGSWKWAAFSVFYTTGLAWFISMAVFQIGKLFM